MTVEHKDRDWRGGINKPNSVNIPEAGGEVGTDSPLSPPKEEIWQHLDLRLYIPEL